MPKYYETLASSRDQFLVPINAADIFKRNIAEKEARRQEQIAVKGKEKPLIALLIAKEYMKHDERLAERVFLEVFARNKSL